MNHLQEIAAVVIVLASVAWLVRRGLKKAAAPCEACEQCGLMAAARGKLKPAGRGAKPG
jgi:hypothetical protein